MIDLHSHVLPGLDDGAPDESVALAMCRMAAADGIRTLVATPHFDAALGVCDRQVIARAADQLRQRLAEEQIDLDLRFAAEMPLTENAVELYRSGNWPAYDVGRNYVLLEVPPLRNGFPILRETVFQLRMAGATPVLAHPERLDMLDDLQAAEQIRMQGALFQITAGCLTSPQTPSRKRALEWLRRGWVHAVASDAHDTSRRPPRLSPARQWLEEHFGADVADTLTRGNPEKILRGELL
jgi:protein-tyrosine phosphatase